MYPIRLLGPADVASCMALKEEAGWNQTEQDWLKLFAISPDGCFGLEVDGELAGTTTVVCYGTQLAWIGMVLTSGRFRRRGIASALMRHSLEYLARKPVDWVKLDATEAGRQLYQRFGFEDECGIERWFKPGARAGFFNEETCELSGGFARGRPGSHAAYFGPCIAATIDSARHLVRWFIDAHSGEAIYWDILPANIAAVDLARSHGFHPVRKLVRMFRRGRPDVPLRPTDVANTYAIAGFEWG